MKNQIGFVIAALMMTSLANAGMKHDHSMPAAKANPQFEQLKKMVGKWEGKTKMGDKEETVKATYELTSGGTAILEKLFVGTPHEMVSVYHQDGDTISMTHYCMLGNQPTMKLKKSEPNSMFFEMVGKSKLHSQKTPHMHSVKLVWNDEEKMTQEWTSYEGKKKQDTTVLNLERD